DAALLGGRVLRPHHSRLCRALHPRPDRRAAGPAQRQLLPRPARGLRGRGEPQALRRRRPRFRHREVRRAMRLKTLGLSLAALVLTAAAPAPKPAAITAAPLVTPADDMVVTHGHVTIGGKPLAYTVHTGLLPIYDNDTGQLAARMFVIAYALDRPAGAAPRPLTFLWNGGPGSSSLQIHLMGFGPKGFVVPDTYPEWKGQPTRLADRPETWL